jgi:glycosyltransferase involved in cell wall biosynthesis
MQQKLKTFWLCLGFLDRDMEINARLQLLKALSKRGVEVRASFNYIKKRQTIDGLEKVWTIRRRANGIIGRCFLMAEQQRLLLKNLDADIIVVWPFNFHQTLPIWFFYRKIMRRRFPKFVMDVRSLPVDFPGHLKKIQRQKRFNTGVRMAFRYFDGLTMITEKMKRDLQAKTGNVDKKVCVWSSGVDPELFNPYKVGNCRNELGFNGRYVLMYHGILSPNRGLQQAVEAVDIVRKSCPEIMFFLLGKGPVQAELEEKIRNLNLQQYVSIHPPVPFEEVPKYINSAQAGILPFPDLEWWNTSSPIKLNEYLSMEKPVIVTDIEAHRAVLDDRDYGFFLPDNKPETIARGIQSAMRNSAQLSDSVKMGRKMIIEKYTWESQAKKIKSYFTGLCSNNSIVAL